MTHVNPRRRGLIRTALLAIALVAGALAGCERKGPMPVVFNSVDITGVAYAQRLELPDADGRMRSLAEFKGKVPVVFFGYTHCPDVCPTTMADLVRVKRELGAEGDKVIAIFVTVDPQRDEAKLLKAYVQGFDPSFVALRGTPEQVAAAAKEFKVYYQQVPGRQGADYTVDHTAASFVFDPAGHPRLFVRNGQDVKGLAADIKALLAGA